MHQILTRREGGSTLHILDDGYDYAGLLDAFRRGEVAGTPLAGGAEYRHATRVERDGRLFVIKTDFRTYRHWDARLKLRLYGPPFLPVMRKVAKAVDAGFDRIQRIYLIEETVSRDPATGNVTVSVWLIIEYLPGEPLRGREDFITHVPPLMNELHRYRLLQSDSHAGNFIIAPDGRAKVIDLHFFSNPFIIAWPRGVMKVEDDWGITFPLESRFDRAVYRIARGKKRLQKFIHGLSKRGR